MKPKQLSDRIGNIEDRLVQQAERVPNFKFLHRKRNIRRMASMAAVIALMVCSFATGAFAFTKEPETIYIEKEQEIIKVGDSGITLILPDEWAGKYGYEINGNSVGVYHLATRENKTWADAGYIFRVECIEGIYPIDYVFAVPGYTIATTATHSYILYFASDVQYDSWDEVSSKEYLALFHSANKIQILLTDWMNTNSTNQGNWVKGTVQVNFLKDNAVADTVTCDKETSDAITQLIEGQNYNLDINSFSTDLWIAFSGKEYFMNSVTGNIMPAAGGEKTAKFSAEDLKTLMSLLSK